MHPILQIEDKVRIYLQRQTTLQELKNWFTQAMGPILSVPAELPGAKLATVIELGLIEMRDGALSERQFRKLLRDQVESTAHFMIEGNPDLTLTESVTSTATGTFDLAPAVSPHPRILTGTSP